MILNKHIGWEKKICPNSWGKLFECILILKIPRSFFIKNTQNYQLMKTHLKSPCGYFFTLNALFCHSKMNGIS